jgi:hypothetical protein
MSSQFEVLSPWAEADLRPVSGISPRPAGLAGKRIGLFLNYKRAAPLILGAVRQKLLQAYPDARFSEFLFARNCDIAEAPEIQKLQRWLEELDTVIAAVGD